MLLLLVTRSMCSASHLLKVFFDLFCVCSLVESSFSFRLGHHIIIPKHITDALAMMLPRARTAQASERYAVCIYENNE